MMNHVTWLVAAAIFFICPTTFAAPTIEPHRVMPNFDRRPRRVTNSSGTVPTPTSAHQSGGSHYVVLFDPDHPASPQVNDVLQRIGLHAEHSDVTHVYDNSAFRGFAGNMKNHCITALNDMEEVRYVEPAMQVSSTSLQTRINSPWGLERLSQKDPVSGDATKMQFHYKYDNKGNLGQGVDIYMLDTGINTDHLAFAGRARMGFSKEGPLDLNSRADGVGHGTHTAGTAGADVFGVASGANLIGVKVLGSDGSGSSADSVKGIDYVVQQHDRRKREAGFIGSVASMSLGSSQRSAGMEQAISAAVDAGVHFSVAAGNEHQDACVGSPASMGGRGADGKGGKAVTVGSINIQDEISSFSNTGPCVDVYAPGEDVISTWNQGKDTVRTLDGTSMATPHVTGLMAYLMAQNQTLARCPSCMKDLLGRSSIGRSLTKSKTMSSPDLGLLINNGLEGVKLQSSESASANQTHARSPHSLARSLRRRSVGLRVPV